MSKYFQPQDPRLQPMIEILDKCDEEDKDIEFEEFKFMAKPMYTLFRQVIQNHVVIKECEDFKARTQKIFDKVRDTSYGGFIPSYIPQLKKVNEESFAVSICTVDGQIFNFGDTDSFVSMQAISSVISYLIALEQHGQEDVSTFIGTEPSGKPFNSLELMDGIPHNPLINSGALTACSLLYQDETIDRKFEYYAKAIKRLIGGQKVHFNNEIYLSEIAHADRNYCLLYMLEEAGTLPEGSNVKKILEFYTMTCAIDLSVVDYGVLAASLANGGI